MKVEILRRDCPSRSPHFNPLRPCGRRRPIAGNHRKNASISIHSARVGGDKQAVIASACPVLFQSTPPVWAETRRSRKIPFRNFISIHSARVGGDPSGCAPSRRTGYFNPLHPCGRRRYNICRSMDGDNFNPLHPCGRRRRASLVDVRPHKFQSTPPVWAETSVVYKISGCNCTISIHSTRVGGDSKRNHFFVS